MIKEYLKWYTIRAIERQSVEKIKEYASQCNIVPLTKGQIHDIQSYYNRVFGRSIPTQWHEYFYSRNGEFSVKYVPSSIFHSQIIWRLNYYDFSQAYVDKGFYDTFFYDINRPRTIVKNMNGYYYDDKTTISREEAIERCKDLGGAVVKPTLGGMRGNDVVVFSSSNGITDSGESVEQLFAGYRKNFIVQERVQQHSEMARLNPSSLNTLRILTYRSGDSIHVMYVIARIGRMGQAIDNLSAGGIYADVELSTGRIRKYAYGSPKENQILETDSGTVLEGFKIPAFEKIVSLAKELHIRLPYFNLIGWDFGVDANGEPLMIEWNRGPDIFSQTAHGPAFGDLTDELLLRAKDLHNTMFVKTM